MRRHPIYPVEVPGGAANNGVVPTPAFPTPDVTAANQELVVVKQRARK
jgi:hypothetical protein